MTTRKLYAAYGANCHREHMATRCSAAKPVGRAKLYGHRLAFRGVADVVKTLGAIVHVALWEITDECERALDRFEGFPHLYVKRTAMIKINGRAERVMFYVMRKNDGEFSPPPKSYENTLRAGYAHFGMLVAQIDDAIAHARKVDSAPPFDSKWHRLDRGEDVTKPKAKAAARVRNGAPESRDPMPSAWEQWRFDSFDERLRKARASPLPNPPKGSNVEQDADARRAAKLLAKPIGFDVDPFADLREYRGRK
jgi:gamma-glutamylcyclotransferase (GGCT)/AIG2-like uncharacterized protein YtfP